MLGSLSYLKETHSSLSSSRDITLPRHKGCDISAKTLTRIKPPHSSVFEFGWLCTCPTISHNPSATVGFMNFTRIPCSWTQNGVRLKSIHYTLLTPLYLYSTIRCLSKLHGSFASMLSTLVLLSKVKRTTLFLRFLILKPFLDRHKGVKVVAMVSMFKARFVRNLATMMNTNVAISLCIRNLGPSLCKIDKQVNCFVRSSIKGSVSVSQSPEEKNPTSLRVYLLH